MNQHFLEKAQIVPAIIPVSLATGANAGDWVNMSHYYRCAIVFLAGAGTAGQDPTITVSQATSNAGANSKALNFTRVDTKAATALTSVAQFTTVAQAAGNTYTAVQAALQKLWVIDIDASTMDGENGFIYLQASVGDVGTNSQIGGMLYILHDPREQRSPLPGAIV